MNENTKAQEYIDNNSDKNQKKILFDNFLNQKLTGELILQDYLLLEEIDLKNHHLTSLKVINCPQIKRVNVRNNQLTNLEITGNNIKELIASKNELTSLDLSNIPNLTELIITDNPNLTEIKGLNLTNLKNVNLLNTLINLGSDYESLKQQNKDLLQALNRVNEARVEGKLTLNTEIIETPKQAEEAIQRHLKKLEQEWRSFFTTGKDPILETNLNSPTQKRKAKEILKWVIEAQVSKDYNKLVEKWNEGKDYNLANDFDGNLNLLMQYLRTRNYTNKNN